MFEEIVTDNELKFNDLEKKIFKFVCSFGCLILKLILESYDRKLNVLCKQNVRLKMGVTSHVLRE